MTASCRRWRFFVLSVASGAACVSSPCLAAVAEELFPELAGLLRDAVVQSPRVVTANLRRLEAEQSMLTTSSARYPQVGLFGTYNYQYEDRGADFDWEFNQRYTASLSANYSLVNWGAVRANADYGHIQAEIEANNVVQAYRQLALEIRHAYLQAVLDKAGIRVARLSDEITRRRLAVLELQVSSGQAASSGLGGARLDVEQSSLSLDLGLRRFDSGLRALRRLTGRADLSGDSIPESIPDVARVTTEDASSRLNDYLAESRFQADGRFANLDRALASEKLQFRIARVAQRPKLNLVTGGSIDQLTYVDDLGERTSVSALFVGLQVNWNIFDGYATRGRVLMSRTRMQRLETQLTDLEEDLRHAAAQSGTDLNLAARALSVAEGRFGGAQGSYNLVEEEVQRQRASPDSLENARLGLITQEMQLFMARRDYLNAVAAWLFNLNADPAVPAAIASPSP